jgi:hypothetical protein
MTVHLGRIFMLETNKSCGNEDNVINSWRKEVNMFLCLIKHHATKAHRRADV